MTTNDIMSPLLASVELPFPMRSVFRNTPLVDRSLTVAAGPFSGGADLTTQCRLEMCASPIVTSQWTFLPTTALAQPCEFLAERRRVR